MTMTFKQFVEGREFHRDPDENVTGSESQSWFSYGPSQTLYILLNDVSGTFSLVLGSSEIVSWDLHALEAQLYGYAIEEKLLEDPQEALKRQALARMQARLEELKRDLAKDGIDPDQLLSCLKEKKLS